jgi:hypothetical protein
VQGWLHRDIKLGNVVINQTTRQVALIDVGGMVPIGTPTYLETQGFLAPELCKRVMLNGELMLVNKALGLGAMAEVVTDKLDVFAAGKVVLQWHVGRSPAKLNDGSNFDAIASCTAADLLEFLRLYVRDDPELAEFLFGTLHPDPAQRWTAMQAIEHSFIRDAVRKVGGGAWVWRKAALQTRFQPCFRPRGIAGNHAATTDTPVPQSQRASGLALHELAWSDSGKRYRRAYGCIRPAVLCPQTVLLTDGQQLSASGMCSA